MENYETIKHLSFQHYSSILREMFLLTTPILFIIFSLEHHIFVIIKAKKIFLI